MARTFDGNDSESQEQLPDQRRRDSGGSDSQYTLEEISEEVAEGHWLFRTLLREEIAHNGLNEPIIELPDEDDSTADRTVNRFFWWNLDRHDFRQLMNEFDTSRQRDQIRMQAIAVMQEGLDLQHFYNICEGLFSGGVDRERIAILFFFCSDLAIQALKRGLRKLFYLLLEWSLYFIATRVARWVHRHGGWTAVLRTSLTMAFQVAACTVFVAVTFACAVYIRRQFR